MQHGTSGQVILPTGSGKTVIAEEIITNLAKLSKIPTLTCVFVPRLLLGKQWITKSSKTLIKNSKIPFAYVNVNSGGISNRIRKSIEEAQVAILGPGAPKIPTTTNPDEVAQEIEKLKNQELHIIALCTYHSSNVIKNSKVNFNLILFDEAHNLVSSSIEETSYRHSLDIKASRRIFLTATRKITESPDGQGMNNINKFGPIVFERKPKHIIEAGAIVGPKIHIIGCNDIIDTKDYNNKTEMIFQAWEKHRQVVKKNSSNPLLIGGKILVVCDGQMTLEGIFSSSKFKEIRKNFPKLRMYGISSSFGAYIDDNDGGGIKYESPVPGNVKEDFLESLYEMKYNDDAIVFHVDMIGEGLDVPSFTGTLFLRNCGHIKFQQNSGRPMRLHPEDAIRIFETGELTIGDWKNYIKPNCYIILPYLLNNRDDFIERYATIIDELRTEYGFDPSENIIADILNPAQVGPGFDEDNLKREIRATVAKKIYNYYHIIEEKNLHLDNVIISDKIRKFSDEQASDFIKLMAKK